MPKTETGKRYGAIVIYPGFRNFLAVATTEIQKLLNKKGISKYNIRVEDRLFSEKLNVHVAIFAVPKSQPPLYLDKA